MFIGISRLDTGIQALALGILTDMAMPTCCSQSIAEHCLLLLGVGLSLGANWTKFSEKVWWKREGLNRDFLYIVAAFGCQLGLLVSAHVRFYMNTKGGPMLQPLGRGDVDSRSAQLRGV